MILFVFQLSKMAPKLYMSYSSAPSRSILMLAKHIGLELELVEMIPEMLPMVEKINPQHTVPTLEDNGYVIWDSHAINLYLAEKYAKDDSLYPKDLLKRSNVNQRLHFDNGALYPRMLAFFSKELQENIRDQALLNQVADTYGFLEKLLGEGYVAGDFLSVADFSITTTINTMNLTWPLDGAKYPRIQAWLKKMEALPCYSVNDVGLEAVKEIIKKAKNPTK